MHGERHDACGEDIVLHVRVPCCPSLLKDIQVHIIRGDIIVIVGVGHRCGKARGIPEAQKQGLAWSTVDLWEF